MIPGLPTFPALVEAMMGPVEAAVLVYFVLINFSYTALLVAAIVEMRRMRNEAVGINDHIVVGGIYARAHDFLMRLFARLDSLANRRSP